ncbi:helix-turn-helix domain-containing protein [Microscilla marina]|uniref:Probable transcriptional regulatory protein, putative n=1 Tax=Microscilla marina ATCC 23134 TaxID=313606 RepID=A1ZXA6_MICM2|nr:AraC family transcriptional regulator [Microscilla marina]EAY24980.1 probable transcriptional regulatory protein, putative [Microscilla marina ATCC 23134]
MQIWNLPHIFEKYDQKIYSQIGIHLILYKSPQEADKANVQLNSNLLVLLLQGHKEVYAPQQKIQLKAGEGFFIRKGQYLMSEKFAQTAQYYSSLMVFFNDDIAQQLSAPLLGHSSPTASASLSLFKLATSDHTQVFSHSLTNYFGADLPPNFDDMLKIKLQELFWILSQGAKGSSFKAFLKSLQNDQAISLTQLMEQHYREPMPLEQLAFLGGYSLSTFKRKFKEVFQQSPSRWIQSRRLQEARFLLTSTQKNITEVGYEVGFENISHFIQVFKTAFGATPGDFRGTSQH